MTSYRDLQNAAVDYQARLRDREIESKGVKSWIRRPRNEDTQDFYGDPVSVYSPREPIYLIPNYTQYYQVIDIMGSDIETELPLEAIAKVHEHIPKDSLILLGARNDYGMLEVNWWRVLSSQIRHLERRTSKTIRMTPVREPVDEFDRTVSINSISTVTVDATRIPG
jgi:hypothetical protein